jgi:hypothetical protein
MSRPVWATRQERRPSVHALLGVQRHIALPVIVLFLAAAPAVARADTIVGSSLAGPPTITKSATVDSVYWAALLGNNVNPAMPSAGTVKSVTIRGYYAGGGYPTIFIQVLRPEPDGSVVVVATSQPFTLSSTPGTYTFQPTNMIVQAGDFIGIATIGGNFVIGTAATGALTNDFSGHNQDMNGDSLKTTATEPNVELLVQVDLVPTGTPPPPPNGGPGGKPPPPPPKKNQKRKPASAKRSRSRLTPPCSTNGACDLTSTTSAWGSTGG